MRTETLPTLECGYCQTVSTHCLHIQSRSRVLVPLFSPRPFAITGNTYIFRVGEPSDLQADQLGKGIGFWLPEAFMHVDEADEVVHLCVVSHIPL